MKNYVVVDAPDKEKLAERVNQRIWLGFEPIGGVAVAYDLREENCLSFYQAMMIKNEG